VLVIEFKSTNMTLRVPAKRAVIGMEFGRLFSLTIQKTADLFEENWLVAIGFTRSSGTATA
jgi:hypothetical protein